MKRILFTFLAVFLLVSCGEHSGQTVSKFTGDYRYYAGIAEFFDCKEHVKYYVADAGVSTELQQAYIKLGLEEKDDVYIEIEGYLKEVQQIEGIDPNTFFVPVKLVNIDKSRGCERAIRRGN